MNELLEDAETNRNTETRALEGTDAMKAKQLHRRMEELIDYQSSGTGTDTASLSTSPFACLSV